MELHQKALLEKRSFFLLPNKLKLYLKNIEGEYENYISYESLTSEIQICCRKDYKLLFIAIATVSFAVGFLLQSLIVDREFTYVIFLLIIAVLLVTLYQIKKQNYIIVETFDRQKVIFLRNKPNRRAVEKFLDRLWLQRKKYL